MGRSLLTMTMPTDPITWQDKINQKLSDAEVGLESALSLAVEAAGVALHQRHFVYAKTLIDLAENIQTAKGASIARRYEPRKP